MLNRKAIIALGSNLGDREYNLEEAVRLLPFKILKKSFVYTSVALTKNPLEIQPEYLNSAILVEVDREPLVILQELQAIESIIGRRRVEERGRWQSRLIDLDLICLDQLCFESEQLHIPHLEMHKRDFVLKPIVEIWPEWKHPVFGKTAEEMLIELSEEYLVKS